MESSASNTQEDSPTTSEVADSKAASSPLSSSPTILPLKSTIGMGPYAMDACCIIPQELILCKPTDPFSELDLKVKMTFWRRQARMLKIWPPLEDQVGDPANWDRSLLQQLRLYIATTPPERRCLCTRRPLDSLDDHWPECPSAVEEMIKRFGERQKKSREMKVRHYSKNLCTLSKEGDMDAIPDEEVRNLHALFEMEFKKRSL